MAVRGQDEHYVHWGNVWGIWQVLYDLQKTKPKQKASSMRRFLLLLFTLRAVHTNNNCWYMGQSTPLCTLSSCVVVRLWSRFFDWLTRFISILYYFKHSRWKIPKVECPCTLLHPSILRHHSALTHIRCTINTFCQPILSLVPHVAYIISLYNMRTL